MELKTYKTAVAIIPTEDIWKQIQEIRRTHDRQFRRWMPHINLLYPFLPRSEFSSLVPQFQEVCSKFSPFKICLNEFRFFRHGKNRFTLWLKPEPDEEIKQLQNELWKIVPECDDTRKFGNGFTPHLSVGQFSSKYELSAFLDENKTGWQPLEFMLNGITIIARNDPPDDIFRVVLKIPF